MGTSIRVLPKDREEFRKAAHRRLVSQTNFLPTLLAGWEMLTDEQQADAVQRVAKRMVRDKREPVPA